ncbi:MAG: efflux RND transporter permease subunit, partial [Phycisphaerales bacterium]|nr:efflux RND transporter permease subunit [Phycisphaerales bacterium]
GLFLEVRLAFWVMLGIPISFAGSLLILPMLGVSINMVSMFAYIIALGIVVDDAIVVGENIYHHHQSGKPFLKAAILGTREVAMPVTFSILTNIVTFVPLAMVPGPMGKIFYCIPAVVVTVFLISLAESLFVLPAHLGHQQDRRRWGLMAWIHARQQAFSHGVRNFIRKVYSPFLHWTLTHRYITISVSLAVLISVIGFIMSGRMGMELFPKVEADFAQCTVTLPYGVSIESTDAVAKRLLDGAQEVIGETKRPELLKGVYANVGKGGNHNLKVQVYLADPEIRNGIMSTDEFTNRWRKVVGEIPGLESMRYESDAGGPGSGAAITVELSHRRMEVLDTASRDLADTLAGYPLCRDVNDGYQPGKRQYEYSVNAEGESLGLNADEISRQQRHAFYGCEVKRQQRGRDEVKIMVRRPKAERVSEYDLEQMMLWPPGGGEGVMLREVATPRPGRAHTTIERRQGRRRVNVTADVVPRSEAGKILDDMKEKILPKLVADYPGLQYSFEGKQADMRESMESLMVTFPIAMLVIYALLAIPFRSYTQPLVVMVSIPFGIVGAVLGHVVMGYSLSMISMFGIVALSGVVVNDSLVLIEFANRRVLGGQTRFDAVREAGVQRFRAIILTTLTTFFGLMPMIFETSRQAKFLIPMAISLGFGILFATIITLVIVPSLYLAVEDMKRCMGALRRGIWR